MSPKILQWYDDAEEADEDTSGMTPKERERRRRYHRDKRAAMAQLNVRIPVKNIEWIKSYADRKGVALNVAVAYAIYILYDAESRDEA